VARIGGGSFFAATVLVNLANFGFHLEVSRLLGASRYGALGAVLSVMVILSVPFTGVQLASASHVLAAGAGRLMVGRVLLQGLKLSAFVAGLVLVLSLPLQSYLELDSWSVLAWLALWAGAGLIGSVAQGLLLGQSRFRPIAGALLAGAGVRLVLGYWLTSLFAAPTSSMAATALGQVVASALLVVPLLPQAVPTIGERMRWSQGLMPTAALTGLAALGGADTVLARHLLPHDQAGIYAGASIAGRIALFAPAAIATIAYPRFGLALGDRAQLKRLLRQSLLVVVAIAFSTCIVLAALPHLVVGILLGDQFEAAGSLLPILAVAGAALAVLNLVVYLLIAKRSRLALVGWPAAVALALSADRLTLDAHGLAVLTAAVLVLVTVMALGVAYLALGEPTAPSAHLVADSLYDAPELDLTMVVPYYNPGPAFVPHLTRLIDVLDASDVSYELILVSDGSTDGSDSLVQSLASKHVIHVDYANNQGKGHALRVGLARGRGRYLGFVDADGDLPADLVRSFVGVAMSAQPDLAIGSKRHPGSSVVYPIARRVYSWGYQQLTRLLFGLAVRDTQTGLKIARRDVLAAALPRMLEKRFAFDLELLVVARRLGYRNVIELPVTIQERMTSTVSLRAVRGVLLDTLAIFYRLRLLRWYDDPHARGIAAAPPVTSESRVGG